MNLLKGTALTLAAGLGFTAATQAAEIDVTADIAVDTVWTADNTYNLTTQIYVLPGASLTIEAGTVVATDSSDNGSLAVTKGAQIFVNGTQRNPVIMTSQDDVATWTPDAGHPTGGDPKTGTWRQAANEWGNLTIMGDGYISENATPGNVATPNASNVAGMEGLTEAFPGDTRVLYGGGNDDDDSGSIGFLSIRYGGRVQGLANELNGLSLGGIGSGTDMSNIEIMNNVDDGIEIWGGCVNLKNIAVWNIGDDSIDIDQGYRGRIQFALIVQGLSLNNGNQGGGVGDNCFETDGAEDSDWEPKTTMTVYNATVIGQPNIGDGGTTWRDNARVQYRNCVFTDLGDQLVRFDNIDGDGANGYGHNGTLSWANTWTTDFTSIADPFGVYGAWGQTDGKLAEITDSVFFNNNAANAYTEAAARGVFDPANNNTLEINPAASPIASITRGAEIGSSNVFPVIGLDPRARNAALTPTDSADPSKGWIAADYSGAFDENESWLAEWTASDAFGFTSTDSDWFNEGFAQAGDLGQPCLVGSGQLTTAGGTLFEIKLNNANPLSFTGFFVSLSAVEQNFKQGILLPSLAGPGFLQLYGNTNANGQFFFPAFPWPAGVPANFPLYVQAAVQDLSAPGAVAMSNAISGIVD